MGRGRSRPLARPWSTKNKSRSRKLPPKRHISTTVTPGCSSHERSRTYSARGSVACMPEEGGSAPTGPEPSSRTHTVPITTKTRWHIKPKIHPVRGYPSIRLAITLARVGRNRLREGQGSPFSIFLFLQKGERLERERLRRCGRSCQRGRQTSTHLAGQHQASGRALPGGQVAG